MLDTYDLTDPQLGMCIDAVLCPQILRDGGMKRTARALERKGWGNVEDGASGEIIFRINQSGADAVVNGPV